MGLEDGYLPVIEIKLGAVFPCLDERSKQAEQFINLQTDRQPVSLMQQPPQALLRWIELWLEECVWEHVDWILDLVKT